MKNTLVLVAVLCLLAGSALPAFPWNPAFEAGVLTSDLDGFVARLQEAKRVDQLGYLVFVRVTPSRKAEDRLFSLAGKVLLPCRDGYLTHVDLERLEGLRDAGLDVAIIDKKRTDDPSENWYLAWIDRPEKDRALRARFEPIFTDQETRVIRIRPADEEVLTQHSIEYSVVEEALLPRKAPDFNGTLKALPVDATIKDLVGRVKKQEMVQTVQTLEDFKSRWAHEPGNASATLWLAEEFRKMGGLTVTTPTFPHQQKTFANVIAVQQGQKDPNTVIVVCGHFDSSGGQWGPANKAAPGADDNGSGVAGVLHIARVAATQPLPYTVMYACLNVEELGLIGSKAMARTLSTTSGLKIHAVLNLDMIADRDDNQVAVIGNTRSNWLIDVFKDTALAYTGLTSKCLYDSTVWNSDHSSFWNIGASAILTIEGHPEMSAYYHKPTDLVKNISPELMEKIARSNLATLLTLCRGGARPALALRTH